MRAVAAEVGVAPMLLYHHVDDRRELLVGMVGHLLEELTDTIDPDRPWATRLKYPFLALCDLANAHPRVFPLVLAHQGSPRLGRLRMIGMQAIADAGVGPEYLARTEAVVWSLVLGFLTRESLRQIFGPPPHGADGAAAAVSAAVEHHVLWVVADPARAHPLDPELQRFADEDDGEDEE